MGQSAFLYMLTSSWASTSCWIFSLFSTECCWLLCQRSNNHMGMGLILGLQFYSIELPVCLCMNTICCCCCFSFHYCYSKAWGQEWWFPQRFFYCCRMDDFFYYVNPPSPWAWEIFPSCEFLFNFFLQRLKVLVILNFSLNGERHTKVFYFVCDYCERCPFIISFSSHLSFV